MRQTLTLLLFCVATYILASFYFAMCVRESDWNDVPARFHALTYASLVFAVTAHITSSIWTIVAECDSSRQIACTVCVALYVAACVAWLPLSRLAKRGNVRKGWVRALLATALLPLLTICFLSYPINWFAFACAIYALFHGAIFDAGIYGYYF